MMVENSVLYDVVEDYTLEVATTQTIPDINEHTKKNTFAYGVAVVEYYNSYDELVYVIAHKDENLSGLSFE